MDNKKLGIILIVIGLMLAVTIQMIKVKEDNITNKVISEKGSCFLEDGTCLHEDRSLMFYVSGWIISAVIISLSIYLIFFEKSQKAIISTLEKQKQVQNEEEKFSILLKGLNEEEKKVLKAVKEQDGITQQTLRFRTGLHKSKLSIVLDGLEKKDLIARKLKGKTKEIFLRFKL
ncbi:MAG: MarR family transcriptional regulator [Nanoarchaeota archaeon]|nr:MarR family transcriptional regulator [Nanoarchaeota archaeon]